MVLPNVKDFLRNNLYNKKIQLDIASLFLYVDSI